MVNRKNQVYRHTPAFILLFLAMEDLYGAALLSKMQKELPCCHADSAVIYRTLQDLEEDGSVLSFWNTDIPGPARKWYKITAKGLTKLGEFNEDIQMRIKNLDFFLQSYKDLKDLSK